MSSSVVQETKSSISPQYSEYKTFVNDGSISSKLEDIGKTLDHNDKLTSIKLFSEQISHAFTETKILDKYNMVLDQSDTGSGKTIVSLSILKWLGYNGIIICPNTAKAVWRKHIDQYNVYNAKYKFYTDKNGKEKIKEEKSDVEIYNFEKLSTSRSFPYLNKRIKQEGKNKIETFEITEEFEQLITSQNTLLIVDEAHSVKNSTSSRTRALTTLITEGMDLVEKFNSNKPKEEHISFKVIFLSATLFDKTEHTKTFLRLMNILRHRNLYGTDPRTGKTTFEGLDEIISFCSDIDLEKTKEILSDYPFDVNAKARSADMMCYQLFVNVILPELSSSMGSQKTRHNSHQKLYNLYLNLDKLNSVYYNDGITRLEDTVKKLSFARENKTRMDQMAWGGLTKGLQLLEFSKMTSLAVLLYKKLSEDKKLKIVVGCWFIDSIKYLTEQLSEFGAESFIGEVEEKGRAEIVELFQKDNNKCRVIVGQMNIISQSISLDDTTGMYRREMYLIPNYQVVPLTQASGRVHRKNTVSNSNVYYIYGKVFDELCDEKYKPDACKQQKSIYEINTELTLLNAIVAKGETLKQINIKQVETGKTFLSDNENIFDETTHEEYVEDKKKYSIEQHDIENAILVKIKVSSGSEAVGEHVVSPRSFE